LNIAICEQPNKFVVFDYRQMTEGAGAQSKGCVKEQRGGLDGNGRLAHHVTHKIGFKRHLHPKRQKIGYKREFHGNARETRPNRKACPNKNLLAGPDWNAAVFHRKLPSRNRNVTDCGACNVVAGTSFTAAGGGRESAVNYYPSMRPVFLEAVLSGR